MSDTFPSFHRLPPEVRHSIWRIAFGEDWAFVALKQNGESLELVGTGRQVVRQSCREAREVMKLTHTYINSIGWIDFSRALLYFRDKEANKRLMQHADVSRDILPHIHHLVLSPANWKLLDETVDRIKRCCTSLRTLVLSAPWPDPPPHTIYNYSLSRRPYEDFSALFHSSPAELLVADLVDAVRLGKAANSEFYKTKLNQALELAPITGPWERPWGWYKEKVQEMEQACQEFANTKPTLSLVRKEEIDPRTMFVPWEDKLHRWISHETANERKRRLRREEQGFIFWPVPD